MVGMVLCCDWIVLRGFCTLMRDPRTLYHSLELLVADYSVPVIQASGRIQLSPTKLVVGNTLLLRDCCFCTAVLVLDNLAKLSREGIFRPTA